MFDMPTIAERLRSEIDSRPEVSYADVARAIGVSRAAMSEILSGKTKQPKPENLLKIADFLRLEIRWLISGQGPKNAQGNPGADYLDLSNLSPEDRSRLHQIVAAFEKPSDPTSGAAGS